jgi:hypothetical protein
MKLLTFLVNLVLGAFLAASAVVGAFIIGCGIGVWLKLAQLTIIWYK